MQRSLLFVIGTAALSGCWFFAPISLDGFVEADVRATCHFAFACCTPQERAAFLQVNFRDEGACVEESLEQGSGVNTLVERAKAVIAKGHGEFDQQRADECLKPLLDAKNQCDADKVLGAGLDRDPLCDADAARAFVVGNVEDGDECDDDIECADYGTCDRSENIEDEVISTKGECVASKREGEVCFDANANRLSPCVPGTRCENDGQGQFRCREIVLADNGEDCDGNGDCKSNFCERTEVGTCFFDDAPCVESSDCATPGDFCDRETRRRCAEPDIKVEACDGL